MASENKKQITILDGGMSRELMRLNAPFRQPEWSALSLIEAPHLVRQVHLEFALAGADVITTNSYALVPFHIGEESFRERGRELATLAGRLAREAADEGSKDGRKMLVAGSLPPIFGSYEPAKFKPEQVQQYLQVLMEALEPWVDIWLGETLSVIAEAEAVRLATRSLKKPLWIAFCPDDSAGAPTDPPRIRSGELISDTAKWASEAKVDALLFNCSNPKYITAAIETAFKLLSSKGDIKIGAYANAFVPRSNEYAANADVAAVDASLHATAYARDAEVWIEGGASIVGGCCGIGVDHIKRLAATFKVS